MTKVLTLKLTGRVFDDHQVVRDYVKVIRHLTIAFPDVKLVVVTGGGEIARRYVSLVRDLSNNESLADIAGILASRLNAYVLISGIPEAYPKPPETVQEFLQALSLHRIVISGGLQPGQSTATVAMLLAELSGSREVIFCSNVDAVYTDDPRKNPNATKLSEITITELENILRRTSDVKAGTYQLIDQWALNIARRAKIHIYILHYRDPWKILDIISSGKGYGTHIIPE